MKALFVLLLLIFLFKTGQCQDNEFPKGWVVNAEFFSGFTTHFNPDPELYLAQFSITPQYAVVPQLLRIGVTGALQYNDKSLAGLFGPSLAIKLKSITVQKFNSSLMNIQLVVENLYGTGKQQLLGTGIKAEIGQKLLVSFIGDRDFYLHNWRFQFGLGFNLAKGDVVPKIR